MIMLIDDRLSFLIHTEPAKDVRDSSSEPFRRALNTLVWATRTVWWTREEETDASTADTRNVWRSACRSRSCELIT